MKIIEKVSIRELQHKLSNYLEIAKIKPLLVTRHGKDEIVLINPKQYKIVRVNARKKSLDDIMSHPFIGMHKNKKGWKGKSSIEIANELRKNAWHGK